VSGVTYYRLTRVAPPAPFAAFSGFRDDGCSIKERVKRPR
jgi:hypothetical protein